MDAAPYATYTILAITVAISLLALRGGDLFYRLALRPYEVRRGRLTGLLGHGFVHADMLHLAFNMFSLYFFAPALESRMGSPLFAVLYLSGLIVAGIPTVLKHGSDPNYLSVGASGAVSAAIFSFIVFEPFAKIIIFPIPFPMPAMVFAGLYLLYSYFAARRAEDVINHDSHFWGAVWGLVFTIAIFGWPF
ncbi:MAG: rhomboid family intramembrane serine protease [Chloroflexota bacterium]